MNQRDARREAHKIAAHLVANYLDEGTLYDVGNEYTVDQADKITEALQDVCQSHERKAEAPLAKSAGDILNPD